MDQYELRKFVPNDLSLLDQLLNNPPLDARQIEGIIDDLLALPMNEEYMKINKCFNYNLDRYKSPDNEKKSNPNLKETDGSK